MELKRISTLCVFLLFLLPIFTFAQREVTTFIGTVTETGGEPLPGVTITAKNVQTELVQATITNKSGRYRLERLPRGIYNLTATLEGFKTSTKQNIEVYAGSENRVDFVLEAGKQEEQITVIGVAPMVETTRAQVSTVLTEKEILSLPQQNRDYLFLMQYAPGAQSGARTMQPGIAFAVNGLRGEMNNYMIDGVDNNDNVDNSTRQTTTLPPEAIQEFRLVTNGFSVETGRNIGGSLNVIMKSGTNELHGSGWSFVRGDSALFRSEDWATHTRNPYERYQYGGTLGGPIVKNKTFFFATVEGLNQRSDNVMPWFYFTPEAKAMAQGAAKQFFDKYGASYPTPSYNFIDENKDGIPDYGRSTAALSDKYSAFTFGFKVDHIFSGKDRVALRFLYNKNQDKDGNFWLWVPGNPMVRPANNITSGLSWLHLFGPTAFNELRIGMHIDNWDEQPMDKQSTYFKFWTAAQSMGDPGYEQYEHNKLYQLADVLNFQTGNHSFKVGGEFRYWTNVSNMHQSANGYWTYQNAMDWILNKGAFSVAFAAAPPGTLKDNPYIPGDPNGVWKQGYDLNKRRWRGYEIGLFAQDDWRIANRLTISLGLRWDFYSVPVETTIGISQPAFGTKKGYENTLAGNYDITEGVLSEEGIRYLIFGGRKLLNEGAWNPYYGNIAPKISFAYDLTGDGKTSLRGGVGVSYERQMSRAYENDRFNYPDSTTATFYGAAYGNPALIATMPGQIPMANVSSLKVSLRWLLPDYMKNPLAWNWLIGIQREIAPNVSIEVDYSGTYGRRLGHIDYRNRYTGDGLDGVYDGINPYCAIQDLLCRQNNTTSNYNGFQIILNKRFSSGWSWYTSYTLSSAKNYSDVFQGGNFASLERPDMEYSWAGYDRRHNLVGGMVYDLPFFKGSKNWFVKNIFAGWQIASSFNFTSGAPFDVAALWNLSYDFNLDGVPLDRPIYLGGDLIKWTNGWPSLDTSKFKKPNLPKYAGTPGNIWETIDGSYYEQPGMMTRNQFYWFPTWNINLSLQKSFTIPVRGTDVNVQLRAEVFNLLKSTFWATPEVNYTLSTFGTVSTMYGTRVLQLSIRFIF
jgi:hypothetical protein